MVKAMGRPLAKPPWLRVRLPSGETHHRLGQTVRGLALHTVCEQARCPNMGECWSAGTATVMLLGDRCTRGCRFCAVGSGKPNGAVDRGEPERVAEAVVRMGLDYAVLTMVTRDDLADGGAGHVAATVTELRARQRGLCIETLVSDFGGQLEAVDAVVAAGPDVFGHNVEVVRAQTSRIRDPRCDFDRSLAVLRRAKHGGGGALLTKSSLLVGVGERDEQVLEAMGELRSAGVDIVTIGQYLRPSPRHAEVRRYVPPPVFDGYRRAGLEMGFAYVASGPLVRSSYRAGEAFVRARR